MMNPRKRPKRLREKQQKAARQAKLVAERITGKRETTLVHISEAWSTVWEQYISDQLKLIVGKRSEDESET